MKGNPRKHLEMFQFLCGKDALQNVVLTTTNWDRVPDNLASSREAELQSLYWRPLIKQGSRVARFHPRTFDTAWQIIDRFSATPRRPLQVQVEMVDQGKGLDETSVFKFLTRWWKKLVKGLNGVVRKGESAITYKDLERAMKEKKRFSGSQSERARRPQFLQRRGM
jgi:hypothetical protein